MTEQPSHEFTASPCTGIDLIIRATEHDLDSFSVRRYLPNIQCRKVGPFVFFDRFGPADFAPGKGIDVRPHPHIGLATISYLFSGEIMHRDSLGFVQAIAPGEVNWMTAGRGIVHSERTGVETRARGHHLHGLQVWVALPESDEETPPAFQHVGKDDLPVLKEGEVSIRLIAGNALGLHAPVTTFSPLFYLDIQMPQGSTLRIPDEYTERALHVITGELATGNQRLEPFDMAVCTSGVEFRVEAVETSRLVLFGGAPISDRFIWWNFVSSSKERIEQAKRDWQEGRFAAVPGETEFIPLPDRR